MKRFSLSIIFILSFTIVVLGDVAPPSPQNPSDSGELKEQDKISPSLGNSILTEKQTCAGVLVLSAAIFLLGNWLIRRSKYEIADKQNPIQAFPNNSIIH